MSVDIRNPEAAVLNREDAQLDCLLILHTSLGKDHFVAVSGIWGKLWQSYRSTLRSHRVSFAFAVATGTERTCFATSLQRLVRMTDPVRSVKKLKLVPENQAATSPKELTRLVGWLMSHAGDVVCHSRAHRAHSNDRLRIGRPLCPSGRSRCGDGL